VNWLGFQLSRGIKVAKAVTHWTIYDRIGSKWDFHCGVEVVLNTVGEILQSVRKYVDAFWSPCQIRFFL
jgi:hypothetical protein